MGRAGQPPGETGRAATGLGARGGGGGGGEGRGWVEGGRHAPARRRAVHEEAVLLQKPQVSAPG